MEDSQRDIPLQFLRKTLFFFFSIQMNSKKKKFIPKERNIDLTTQPALRVWQNKKLKNPVLYSYLVFDFFPKRSYSELWNTIRLLGWRGGGGFIAYFGIS